MVLLSRFVLAAASNYQGQSNTPNLEKASSQKVTWCRKNNNLQQKYTNKKKNHEELRPVEVKGEELRGSNNL